MATLLIDGFDKYGPTGISSTSLPTITTTLTSAWTNINTATALSIVAPLSATGYALKYSSNASGSITKTLATSYSNLIGGIRFNTDLGGGSPTTIAPIVQFQDSGTAQCSIQIMKATGFIRFVTGNYTGTTIATSVVSVLANSTHYLEWDITFGAAASYTIYLDGISILTGTGNTKTTANSSANVFLVGQVNFDGNGQANTTYDDLYLFDTTGSTCNAVLLTNPRVITQVPTSDSQTQFTNVATLLGPAYSATSTFNSPGSNELFLRKFTSSVAQTLNSVTCIPLSNDATAKVKGVIYPDSGGSPNGQSLITTGNEFTGAVANTAMTSTFGSPPSLSASTDYWIGFIVNNGINFIQTDSTNTAVKAANTYGSGAPATCPTVTTTQPSWVIYGSCTGAATNWSSEDDNPPPGDSSSISSSTVSNEDLYGFPSLPAAVTDVYTVAVKGNVKKSDSGARTIDLRLKSGATDSAGTSAGQTPATSYTWLETFFDEDPNTSAVWVVSDANSATAGPKVAS